MRGSPNPYYYKDFLEINFCSEDRERFLLGDFGKKMKLCAGSNWFIGKDFVAWISYPADDYYWHNSIGIFIKDTTPLWHELKRHVCELTYEYHALKTLKEFLDDIFKPRHTRK